MKLFKEIVAKKYMEKCMKEGVVIDFYVGNYLGRADSGQLFIRENCIEIKKYGILNSGLFAVIPFDEIKSINVVEEGGLINTYVQVSINVKDNCYNIKFISVRMNEVMPVIDLLNEKVNASQVNEDAKFCPQCGSPVQAGAKFCSQCGAEL